MSSANNNALKQDEFSPEADADYNQDGLQEAKAEQPANDAADGPGASREPTGDIHD